MIFSRTRQKHEPGTGPRVRGARRWLRRLAISLVAGLSAFAAAWLAFPFPAAKLASFPSATVLLDREGRPMRVRLGPADTDCRLSYEPRADDWIAKAIVAAEDRRFWSHRGVDPLALARAVAQNIAAGRRVSGASTLSSQVVRLIEPRPRTAATKLVEFFRALQLERLADKGEILRQYLNRAPFGSNLVGVQAAAQRYFGKHAGDLSLAEAALLAGLPQSPSRLRPDRHPERAKARQRYVLHRLLTGGWITAEQHDAAAAQPIRIRPEPYPFRAPHFCELAASFLPAGSAGQTVRTTLDSRLQALVEQTLKRHADRLRGPGVRGGAIVVLEVRTGAVRALAGSPDFGNEADAGQVNAAWSPRSAGSTLKPFIFAMAFDRGRLTPGTVMADVPRVYRDYKPDNFSGDFMGLVSARHALILSLNMPVLSLVEDLGQPEVYRMLRRLGLDTLSRPPESYGIGLALGNGEVRLLDLANAYACLARGGGFQPVRFVEDGDEHAEPDGGTGRLFSREAAWMVSDILSGDERALRATGHMADVAHAGLAWKTGTSSGFRDAWTVAYNPEYVVGVWFGNPNGAPSPALVGLEAAAPAAWDIFRSLYPSNEGPWFERPAGIRTREVCAASGHPALSHCPARVEDFDIDGATLHRPCPVHRLVASDVDGTTRIREVWPAPVQAFLDRQARSKTAASLPAPEAEPAGSRLKILSPAPGAVYRRDESSGGIASRLPLEASGATRGETLHWFVDDRPLHESSPGQTTFWPLQRGAHRIVVSDRKGRSDQVLVRVE